MALEPLFIDSGGFYALVSTDGEAHAEAVAIMEESRRAERRAITTDYVLDETATLLRARGLMRPLKEFLRLTEVLRR
jgi:predicted nucleic acid-binding protein